MVHYKIHSLLLLTIILTVYKVQMQKIKLRRQISLLENQIKTLTIDLEYSNEKIKEYAYINSHEVRGPLARILGMVHLIDIDSVSADEGYERIKESAIQLDSVICTINMNLDEQNTVGNKFCPFPITLSKSSLPIKLDTKFYLLRKEAT